MTIDANKAVFIAMSYFRKFYKGAAARVMVEEIEMLSNHWVVTVGFDIRRPVPRSKTQAALGAPTVQIVREYKELHIRNDTGQVSAMKIRKID